MFYQFGTITLPGTVTSKYPSDPGLALGKFLNIAIQLLIMVAGIYALINLILAGYQFMSSAGDPKGTAAAWAKIWQTIMGLVFVAGAFVLAAIFGQIIFGDPKFLLQPTLITP